MKRFLIKLLPFVIWIFLLMVVVPVTIDPYNVFHVENIRDNGIEPNKNFLKTEYVIRHPDRFDAFLFGSSRVSSIHSDRIEGYRCYNTVSYTHLTLPTASLVGSEMCIRDSACAAHTP